MAFRNTNSSESWDRIYTAFQQVNFTSFDFDTIKASLVDYLRIYYPETFNDLIQSSELIALLELFAYVAEQLAYRVDMVSHENFITTAQRKQSILRLAKLISYKATRNIPVRGLVKFTSVSTTESVIDSRGIDLAGLTINWNDPNNSNWKEQFLLVMNRSLTTRFGQPQKSFQIGDVVMDLYALKATQSSFNNGVYPFTASTGLDSYPMEVVPADLDDNGPFEREPDPFAALSLIYANDGIGDGSDYTGFLAYVKQGTMSRIDYNIQESLPNRKLELLPDNVNHTDVWVQKINGTGQITERWKQVETINEQNLIFNNDRSSRKKYEVDTLENDQVAIVFGDGDFTDTPVGLFRFWLRQSANRAIVIPKNKVVNEPLSFTYIAASGNTETCTLTFSLTTTLQNGSASETIEHIRQSAPATYYAQNRMVNGQDYNTYMLKDPSILRLKTVNRTFAGQPKYIDWNDASGSYENVKIFGDDLIMRYELRLNSLTTSVSGQALIDSVIEPLLNDPGIITALTHISATNPATVGVVSSPRRSFIEDNRANTFYSTDGTPVTLINGSTADGSLKEKTAMQALIDRHWYGEALEFVEGTNNQIWARIPDPDLFPKDDSRIYAAQVPRTIDGINRFPPGDIGSGLQPIAEQDYFALRYNRTLAGVGNGSLEASVANFNLLPERLDYLKAGEVWTLEVAADGETLNVRSSLRGTFAPGTVSEEYDLRVGGVAASAVFFQIVPGTVDFEPGDSFILDTSLDPILGLQLVQRGLANNFSGSFNSAGVINLNGYWEILGTAELSAEFASGPRTEAPFFHDLSFRMDSGAGKRLSWLIFVQKLRQSPSNAVIGYEVHYRDLEVVVHSQNTKFWFNDIQQLLDSETQKRVFDSIKILRSNVDAAGVQLVSSQTYDVVGAVKNGLGEIDFNRLQVVPSDLLQENESGDLEPDRLLQFVNFAGVSTASYEYFELANAESLPAGVLDGPEKGAAIQAFIGADPSAFSSPGGRYGRRQVARNQADDGANGLDFMYQHFAPYTNIINPSVTNIHDAYILTQGYYDSITSYIRGLTGSAPLAPTPLDLRNSFSYLLQNKMLSDTVVMHPGKLRLLFGALAEPQLRARFKIVRAPGATLTNERIKEELLNVINTYFDISAWDFGDTFYATELIAMMHQRLPADIASVVLVPLYSTNSFGDLFTVECGFDEILQSAAGLSDIEIVEALTPSTIRQVK